MELCGHKEKFTFFNALYDTSGLGHAYLFFGDPHIGKYAFAQEMVKLWDASQFETLLLEPGEGTSIGIDQVRALKNFLIQKPMYSQFRTVIFNELETITDAAQNALLKVLEEPPAHGILIGIVPDPALLFPTIRSRFQQVYFPRVPTHEIATYAMRVLKTQKTRAETLAGESYGRPGMLIEELHNEKMREIKKEAERFISHPYDRSAIIASLLDTENVREEMWRLDTFFHFLIALLRRDCLANHQKLRAALTRLTAMKRFQTHKKLQLEALARMV